MAASSPTSSIERLQPEYGTRIAAVEPGGAEPILPVERHGKPYHLAWVWTGRCAPTVGNRHLQRFVITDAPGTLRVLRMVSPGMLAHPTAAITICTDRRLAAEYGFAPDAPGLFIDVGTAAATLMLAAHALGVGAGPVTSFSRAAVGVVLRLPEGWVPELVLCLGHPAVGGPSPMSGRRGLTWRDLTSWVPNR